MKNYSVIGIYKTGQDGFEHIIPDTNDPENWTDPLIIDGNPHVVQVKL